MRLPPADPRTEKVINLLNALSAFFEKRKENEEVAMSAMLLMTGVIIGNICHTEDSLLRAITLSCDGVRSSATDAFVDKQTKRRRGRR